MAAELEAAHRNVTTVLYQLKTKQLEEVAEELEVEGLTSGLSRLRLIELIGRHLDSEKIESQPDGGLAMLKSLKVAIDEKISAEPASSDGAVKESTPAQTQSPPVSSTEATSAPAQITLKREFKISGQIGEPGQKDKLSYSSLLHQIQHGLEKKHSEKEIVAAVVRSIVPGSKLRSYLEGKSDLGLPNLRRLLRSHFHEKDATELFNELSRLVQGGKESAQSFLIRAMELRQRVVFASQEAGSSFQYDAALVKGVFLHSAMTGLRDGGIKAAMRPYFNIKDIRDEDLFEHLNTAATNEEESRSKLRKGNTSQETRVEAVEVEDEKKTTPKKSNPLVQEVRDSAADINMLKVQMAEIRDAVMSLKTTPAPSPPGRPPRPYGCLSCRQSGNGPSCSHCFKCGSSEHFARGCRQKRVHPGNARGLLPRDEQ